MIIQKRFFFLFAPNFKFLLFKRKIIKSSIIQCHHLIYFNYGKLNFNSASYFLSTKLPLSTISLIYLRLVFIGLPLRVVARFPSSRSPSPSCLLLRSSSSYRKLFYLAKARVVTLPAKFN